jgi:sugar (pentulose or hexulose) kinase
MNSGHGVLAIDIGSTAVRAAVIGASGTIHSLRLSPRPDASSGLSFDPALLWRQLVDAVAAIPAHVKRNVAGIGITAHIGTVLTDNTLSPIGPASGWSQTAGVDDASARIGDQLERVLSETGRATLTGGGMAAALALRAKDPESFARVAHILSPKDYLIARMTGEVATDFTSAAYTGASDVESRSWSTRTLDLVGLEQRLFPRQLKSTDPVGRLQQSTADEFGMPSGTVVFCGGPDGSVGATYVVGDRTDVVADIAGTTDVLLRVVGSPLEAPPGSVVNPYTLGRWAAGGPTGSTGGALSQWAQLLGLGTAADALALLGAEIIRIGPGSAGLTIGPSLSGSRFPRWNPSEKGVVRGMSDAHGPEHFIRAVAEGAAYVVREGVDLLAGENGGNTVVVLAGGVTHSSELCQMRADVFNREVLVSTQPDVSLLGAGLLGLLGAGVCTLSDGAAFGKLTRRIHPNPRKAERYEALYQQWRTDAVSVLA